MNVHIRPMRMEDLPQAAAIERICFTQEAWSEKVYREEYARMGTWIWFWCAIGENASVLGTISLTRAGDAGEIGNVAVLPGFRRQGIPGKLLAEAIRFGEKELGLLSFTLEVRTGNAAAIHLYEAAGFHEEGCRPRFYTEPVEDALIMWRR